MLSSKYVCMARLIHEVLDLKYGLRTNILRILYRSYKLGDSVA